MKYICMYICNIAWMFSFCMYNTLFYLLFVNNVVLMQVQGEKHMQQWTTNHAIDVAINRYAKAYIYVNIYLYMYHIHIYKCRKPHFLTELPQKSTKWDPQPPCNISSFRSLDCILRWQQQNNNNVCIGKILKCVTIVESSVEEGLQRKLRRLQSFTFSPFILCVFVCVFVCVCMID